jgi:hypothetical protein
LEFSDVTRPRPAKSGAPGKIPALALVHEASKQLTGSLASAFGGERQSRRRSLTSELDDLRVSHPERHLALASMRDACGFRRRERRPASPPKCRDDKLLDEILAIDEQCPTDNQAHPPLGPRAA